MASCALGIHRSRRDNVACSRINGNSASTGAAGALSRDVELISRARWLARAGVVCLALFSTTRRGEKQQAWRRVVRASHRCLFAAAYDGCLLAS
jgi:hypothetical protein